MLTIVEYGKDGYEFPALIVLGCFDAVHLGHRELLKKAKLQAKINGLDLGVMVFKGGKSDKLLYSFEERIALLEQYNVKFVLAVEFNEEFKAIAPLDFLREIEDKINVKAYMSGKDFRFGAQAKGKSSTLKNYAEDDENGVWYMPVKDVTLGGDKVSTTLIKSCLDAGNVARANALLGGEFSLSGEVVKGEGRGTSVVGFPTVNIVYPDWKYPIKQGVYSVKCTVGDTDYQGIANFGTCPTFGDKRVALETYLEGFSGDLYGQTLTIRFIDYVRDIEQFESPSALSAQLQSDLQSVSEEVVVADASSEVVEEVVEAPAVVEQPVEEGAAEPEEQTEQPVEELAAEPEAQTEQSVEEVTAEPEAQTEQSVEEVTAEPEEQTEQSVEEVTAEPEEQTEQSVEEVTAEPEAQTEQPVEELAAEPEAQTEQPVEEVAAEPEAQTEQSVEEVTAEPEEQTEQSVEELAAEPEAQTEQPVEEVAAEPEAQTEQPVEEVAAEPEAQTEQPVEEVAAEPEAQTEQPVEEVAAEPEEQTEQPVEEVTAEPEEQTEQPVEEVTAEPEEQTEQPVEELAAEPEEQTTDYIDGEEKID